MAVRSARPRGRWTRTALVGVLLTVAGGLTACGVPMGGPQPLSKSRAPGLFSPLPPTTVPPAGVQVDVFLLGPDQVPTPVKRTVGVHSDLTSVLSALVAGPYANESVTTAIPPSTTVLSAIVENDVVTVDFSADFGAVSGAGQIEAAEQVVYTVATWLKKPDIGVAFEIENVQTPVPTLNPPGTYEPGPVTEQNYPLPQSGATTTTTTTAPRVTSTTGAKPATGV